MVKIWTVFLREKVSQNVKILKERSQNSDLNLFCFKDNLFFSKFSLKQKGECENASLVKQSRRFVILWALNLLRV